MIRSLSEMKKRAVGWMMESLPDGLLGNRQSMEDKCLSVMGRIPEKTIQKEREKNLKRCAFFAVCVGLCLALTLTAERAPSLDSLLVRPDHGQAPGKVRLAAQVDWPGQKKSFSMRETATIQVQPRSLSDEEREELLQRAEKELEEMVLGDGNKPGKITRHINLISLHEETGVRVSWNLDEAELVKGDGTIRFLKIEKPKAVTVRARLTLEGMERVKVYTWLLYPAEEEEMLVQAFSSHVRDLSDEMSWNQNGDEVSLRHSLTLDEGAEIPIRWELVETRKSFFGLLVLTAALAVIARRSRYKGIEAHVKQYQKSIDEDIADMVNEFVLLMNAGLVAQSAFRFMADAKGTGETRPLFVGIQDIVRKVEASNTSFMKEFILFAKRSQSRELMRFAAILQDNISKGSALVEKLETERELLWSERKKAAEMKAREAETKLAVPLILLLAALICITIAPAAMEL